MRSAYQPWLGGTVPAVCLLLLSGGMAAAQQTQRFEEKTAERLAELQVGSDEVQSIRYVLKRKLDDKAGPDIRGAYAYIRLSRCSGYLVVDMNRTGYIRQTYTTGDCKVGNMPSY